MVSELMNREGSEWSTGALMVSELMRWEGPEWSLDGVGAHESGGL